MIKVKQSRKLMNHCRTLTIEDYKHDTECRVKDIILYHTTLKKNLVSIKEKGVNTF